MPSLDTQMHVKMLQEARDNRVAKGDKRIYGMEWGDPETDPALRQVVSHHVLPHVHPDRVCLEIGPGGGRWTRYLMGFKTIYAVDFYQELLDELARNFSDPKIVRIRNNGYDFPGVPPHGIDFLFSYGAFVHIDLDVVEKYLEHMHEILKPEARVFIHYPDKRKVKAQKNKGFAINTPGIMRPLVESKGYRVLEEETELLDHSAIIVFTPARKAAPG